MSGGGVKHFFEQPAAEDSRVFAQLGRTLHWPGLTEEAKHNEQNPGRAMTKATVNAALWYLGGELGDYLGSGSNVGSAAADAGDESAGLSMASPFATEAGGTAGDTAITAAQLAKMATADSTDVGLLGTSQSAGQLAGGLPGQAQEAAAAQAIQQPATNPGLLNSLQRGYGQAKGLLSNAYDSVGDKAASMAYRGAVPGAGAQQADMLAAQTGDFGGYGLAQTMKAAAGAQGLSGYQQLVGQYGGQLLGNLSGAGTSPAGKMLALEMGKGLLMPQRQPMPQGAPMRGGGSDAPLTNPYGQNSLTMNTMSEADKQKLRALGYNIP